MGATKLPKPLPDIRKVREHLELFGRIKGIPNHVPWQDWGEFGAFGARPEGLSLRPAAFTKAIKELCDQMMQDLKPSTPPEALNPAPSVECSWDLNRKLDLRLSARRSFGKQVRA